MECEIERTDDLDYPLLLDSHVEQVIIFRIKPKTAGPLSFIGLSYSLTTPDIENCEIIQVNIFSLFESFFLVSCWFFLKSLFCILGATKFRNSWTAADTDQSTQEK